MCSLAKQFLVLVRLALPILLIFQLLICYALKELPVFQLMPLPQPLQVANHILALVQIISMLHLTDQLHLQYK